jgi:hypothetical protein
MPRGKSANSLTYLTTSDRGRPTRIIVIAGGTPAVPEVQS